MAKEMLINVSEGEECRIALLQDEKLEELYMERTSSTSHVGNIYKGRVTNVEASIQAAFIDFGLPRNGFLHITDLLPQYFGRKGEDVHESVGRKMARRDRPPIQKCLRRGDEITVQIIKEGIGTKGPTLSTYLSIPGRILVMMPGMSQLGVSRKIEDEAERRRLRQILDSLKPPKECGFIIRTAGVGKTKADIERDLKYLTRLWENFKKTRDSGPAPIELYREGDLVTRTVRDVFSGDIERIVVDSKEVAHRVKEFIKLAMPRTRNRVELYEETMPLFHKYGIEREIEQIYSRHVPLPSGGGLVIDSTEAVVAIDVNSGKFREHADAETTAFKTDMEAADEITRQLKLRDLGGVIICDFIDLRFERHRRELEKRLHDNFKNDRARTHVLHMSQFGIIEITRQRMRPSLKRSIYFDCPHCKGAGLVKTPESMSLDVMRRLAIAAGDDRVRRMELAVCPEVDFYLQNRKRRQLAGLEQDAGKKIVVRAEATLGLDEMRLSLFDARDGQVLIQELQSASEQPPHATQLGGARGGHPQDRRNRHPQDPSRRAREVENEAMDERMEMREKERSDEDEEIGEPGPERAESAPREEGPDNRQEMPREGGGRRRRRGRRGRGGRGGGDRRQEQPRQDAQPQRGELSLAQRLAGVAEEADGRDDDEPFTDSEREESQPREPDTRYSEGSGDSEEFVGGDSSPAEPARDALDQTTEVIGSMTVHEPESDDFDDRPRGRRRRGGRRRGGQRTAALKAARAQGDFQPQRSDRAAGSDNEPPPRIVEETLPATRGPVVRQTTDEEPAAPRRPRTYRDLDEIPDDFD